MIELEMKETDQGWDFIATEDGDTVARLVAERYEDKVVIHNNISRWSKYHLTVYRKMFVDVRAALRESGIYLIIACSDNFTKKMGKFWRLMGFEFIEDTEIDGTMLKLAVMEA